jgi:hypothetical protein
MPIIADRAIEIADQEKLSGILFWVFLSGGCITLVLSYKSKFK